MSDNIFKIRGDRPAARIQVVLDREQAKRPRDLAEEELAVWRATNEERARIGKIPVPLEMVTIANSMASGHIDYASKFPFYCERMVLDTP